MKSFSLILFTFIVIQLNCQEDITVDTDYSPATLAYTQLRAITQKQTMFKERVKKNVSIEYENCVNSIKTLRCNNVDQWQSVVEELKLENENSESSEIPFLQKRKSDKVDQLKKLLDSTAHENEVLAQITGKISENQKKIMNYYHQLDSMYKLPEYSQDSEFIQIREEPAKPAEETAKTEDNATAKPEKEPSEENVAKLLNADVPDLAKEQLGKAKNEYDIADESIQAQTASNLLKNYVKKISETLKDLQSSFDSRFQELLEQKQLVKSDILKARALLDNEVDIQGRNLAKIAEIEGLIAACEGQPTNIEKDCEPIRVNASKILTELDIVEVRSTLLYKELSKFLEENKNSASLDSHSQQLSDTASAAQQQAEIDSYLYEKDPPVSPRDIVEQNPIHHLKDNMPKEEKKEEEQEATAEEKPAEEKPAADAKAP